MSDRSVKNGLPMIQHDLNGPFVRAARSAWAPQTETVWAYRVETSDGVVEYWNERHNQFSDTEIESMRASAMRRATREVRLLSMDVVTKTVTISGTDWSLVRANDE